MALSLDEFIAEAKQDLQMFEDEWRKQHAINPEAYPLEMSDGNEGQWWEFLITFGE